SQARGDLDFAKEPVDTDAPGELRPEHLERDLPAVPFVVGDEDDGHASAPDLTVDAVPAREGRAETLEQVLHGTCREGTSSKVPSGRGAASGAGGRRAALRGCTASDRRRSRPSPAAP